MTKIAMSDLGTIGLPMATWLMDGFNVLTYGASDEQRKLAEKAGSKVVVDTPRAIEEADVALVAVRDATQLETLFCDPGGIVVTLPKGIVVILTSVVRIMAAELVAARLEEDGIGLVDALVSDGPARVDEGDLLMACGTLSCDFKKTHEVLGAIVGKPVPVGDRPGKNQALKMVSQLLCNVHIVATGEASALTGELGLDQRTTLEALVSGVTESLMLGHRGPRTVEAYEEGDPNVASCLDISVKDTGIVMSAAKDAGMAIPMATAAEQLYLARYMRDQGAVDDLTVIRVPAPGSEGWGENRLTQQSEHAAARDVEDQDRPRPLVRWRGPWARIGRRRTGRSKPFERPATACPDQHCDHTGRHEKAHVGHPQGGE